MAKKIFCQEYLVNGNQSKRSMKIPAGDRAKMNSERMLHIRNDIDIKNKR